MTTDEMRRVRQAWAQAHLELEQALQAALPAASAADANAGERLQTLLTDQQAHLMAELYGKAVGYWSNYRELLREAR